MLGDPDTEQHRVRVGLVCLIVGLSLLVWAWGSWVYRISPPSNAQALRDTTRQAQAEQGRAERSPSQRSRVAQFLPLFLVVAVVLVLVALFGGYALLRASRRYRAAMQRERPPPSDTRDAWWMYRLPEMEDEED